MGDGPIEIPRRWGMEGLIAIPRWLGVGHNKISRKMAEGDGGELTEIPRTLMEGQGSFYLTPPCLNQTTKSNATLPQPDYYI